MLNDHKAMRTFMISKMIVTSAMGLFLMIEMGLFTIMVYNQLSLRRATFVLSLEEFSAVA